MYYYVNILLTKNALNTFISNENNFVQNQLLRSADSISFSFIPVAYSALLCWSPASIDFNGAAFKQFFSVRRNKDGHWIMLRLCPAHGRSASLGWMEEWAGPDSERLRDDWRVCHLFLIHFYVLKRSFFWGRQLIKTYLLFFFSLFAIHIVTYQLFRHVFFFFFFINKWQGGGSFSQCKKTVGVGVGVVFRLWRVSLCVSISNSVPSRILHV